MGSFWGVRKSAVFGVVLGIIACCQNASASAIFVFSDPNYPGLGARAEFILLGPTTLEIHFENTSTGVPNGFSNSDQILTGLSWDFDPPGSPATTAITGGNVKIGGTSQSINFDSGSYGPGATVSGEWAFGNMDGTGALWNFISSNTAQATPFGGANLDGPSNVDGPQGGLVANPLPVAMGGLGAIQTEVIATLSLSNPITNLDFLAANLVRVEFGSDAAFITVPEPSVMAFLALGGALLIRRRSSRAR